MTAVSSTYHWIKRVPSALLHMDKVPLVGSPPPFPWAAFSTKISELFSISNLSIQPTNPPEWRTKDALLTGLGHEPVPLYFTVTPELAPICWVLSKQDINTIMALLLSQQPHSLQTIDKEFQAGFYQFLAVEVMNAFISVSPDKTLSPHLLDKGELPSEPSLCLDICFSIKQQNICGRLILPEEFLRGWRERYTVRTLDPAHPLLQHIEVTVQLEAGRLKLKPSELYQIKLGDFIILDSCTLKAGGEGRIMLNVNGMPMFRGKIKDGNIKILEHPLYHEEGTAMSNDKPPENNSFAGEEEMEQFDEEYEEEEEGFDDAFLQDDLNVEASQAESTTETPPLASQPPSQAPSKSKDTFSPEDLPVSIVVEVGRIQMNLQTLMQLQPGNVLELNVHPENGVDLVVNGKRIGKGELLLIGEALGLRILDIG